MCEGLAIDANSGLLTAIATIAVAAFTLTLWLSADGQARLTREAIDESKRSSERQLRAYVFVDTCSLQKDVNDGESPWEIHLQIKNYGLTPTSNIRIVAQRNVSDIVGDDPEYPLAISAQPIAYAPIPPGHFFTVRAPIMTPAQRSTAAQNGQRVYTWGRVDYRDAFGKERWLMFQMEHMLDNVHEFRFCRAGNDWL
ncbi:MAG TPA: hypothetical protein VHZ78_00490 [Rhizomicrobium sp.]|nr:hypothetical protein [Rhizomicrobium sp.]